MIQSVINGQWLVFIEERIRTGTDIWWINQQDKMEECMRTTQGKVRNIDRTVRQMIEHGDEFLSGSEVIYQYKYRGTDYFNGESEKVGDSGYFLRLFALELYLKAIYCIEKRSFYKGHCFDKIFVNFKDETQDVLLVKMSSHSLNDCRMQLNSKKRIKFFLKRYGENFLSRCRYFFERSAFNSDAENILIERRFLEDELPEEEMDIIYSDEELAIIIEVVRSVALSMRESLAV